MNIHIEKKAITEVMPEAMLALTAKEMQAVVGGQGDGCTTDTTGQNGHHWEDIQVHLEDEGSGSSIDFSLGQLADLASDVYHVAEDTAIEAYEWAEESANEAYDYAEDAWDDYFE